MGQRYSRISEEERGRIIFRPESATGFSQK